MLILGWVTLLITGYVIQVWLGRTFGPETYGLYGVVTSVLMWLEIFVITGLPYSVQKFVSSDEKNAYSILWTAGRVQAVLIGILFLVGFIAAPFLANLFPKVTEHTRLPFYFRIAFLHLIFYGFFHLFISLQNGLRRFNIQAGLFALYALSKVVLVILLVSLFKSLTAALLAGGGASLVGAVVGFLFVKDRVPRPDYKRDELIRFAAPTLIFTLAVNILLSIDLWVVTAYWGDKASGFYTASGMISRIPYFVVLGLSGAVLPTISNQLSAQAKKAVKGTIELSLRFLLIFSMPVAILISLYSQQIMTLLYTGDYAPAGNILSMLIWGIVFLSFLLLLTTILIADHRPRLASGIALSAVVLDVVFNLWLVPHYGPAGGAVATTLAAGIGCAVAAVLVYRRFKVLVTVKTMMTVVGGGAMIWLLGAFFELDGLNFLWICGGGLLLYVLILLFTKEIRIKDIWNLVSREDDGGSTPFKDTITG